MKTTFKNVPVFTNNDEKTEKVLREFRVHLKNKVFPTVYVRAHTRSWPVKVSPEERELRLLDKKFAIEVQLKGIQFKLRNKFTY